LNGELSEAMRCVLYIDLDYKNVKWEEWTERLCFVLENLNIEPKDIRIFETEKG